MAFIKLKRQQEYKELYKKMISGMKWLNKKMENGKRMVFERQDFKRTILDPLDTLWGGFTDEEKERLAKDEAQNSRAN